MRKKVYLLIVPVRAGFKERVFQTVSETIQNQQYRFELNIRSKQSVHIMGSTTNFEMINPEREMLRLNKPQNNEQKQLVHHFSVRYNMIEFSNWIDDIKSQKFSWSIYFRVDKQGKKKQLKTFSTQFYLEEVIKKYQQNSSNYKFKQSIYFGKKQVELIFKIFILETHQKLESIKTKIINSEIEKLMKSNSMEYIRDDFRSKNIHKTFRMADENSSQNQLFVSENLTRQKLSLYEMAASEHKMKLLTVKKKLITEPKKEDDLICETVSMGVPLKNQQRFATKAQEQQFNEKLNSFIQFNQTSQPRILTPKLLLIILATIIILYLVSSQLDEGSQRPKKPKKRKVKNKNQKKYKPK